MCVDFVVDGGGAELASDDRYPVASDPNFLNTLHDKLAKDEAWATPELFKAVQFAWGVLLREYASRPDLLGKCVYFDLCTLTSVP